MNMFVWMLLQRMIGCGKYIRRMSRECNKILPRAQHPFLGRNQNRCRYALQRSSPKCGRVPSRCHSRHFLRLVRNHNTRYVWNPTIPIMDWRDARGGTMHMWTKYTILDVVRDRFERTIIGAECNVVYDAWWREENSL